MMPIMASASKAVNSYLVNQVGAAYDAMQAEPSRAVTADQIRERLGMPLVGEE